MGDAGERSAKTKKEEYLGVGRCPFVSGAVFCVFGVVRIVMGGSGDHVAASGTRINVDDIVQT